jgi:hypothetical protein
VSRPAPDRRHLARRHTGADRAFPAVTELLPTRSRAPVCLSTTGAQLAADGRQAASPHHRKEQHLPPGSHSGPASITPCRRGRSQAYGHAEGPCTCQLQLRQGGKRTPAWRPMPQQSALASPMARVATGQRGPSLSQNWRSPDSNLNPVVLARTALDIDAHEPWRPGLLPQNRNHRRGVRPDGHPWTGTRERQHGLDEGIELLRYLWGERAWSQRHSTSR